VRKEGSSFELSASDLVGYLNCRHLSALERAVAEGAAKRPYVWDPLLKILWERGSIHEQNYVEHLTKAGLEVVRIDGFDVSPEVVAATITAMRRGAQIIVALPKALEAHLASVRDVLKKVAGKLDIKNADERVIVKTRQAVLESTEFEALWDRIKHKTTYRVHFDNEKLIADCAKAIASGPPVSKARVRIRKANLSIGQGGVEATEHDKNSGTIVTIEEGDIALPDVLTDLQDCTQLTRRSLVRILTECERLKDFKRNPQAFIEIAGEVINRTKRLALVDGIKYQRVGDDSYYAQELFAQEELTGYLRNMLKDAQKSVFEHVIYDSSGIERTFAEQLEKNESVKMYAKLPAWFKVPTPLGTYNPDWAVLVEVSGEERLYFVVETKGSLFVDALRDNEAAKVACGEAHFKALAVSKNPARYIKATKVDDLMALCLP
jgi:type III restriction enzyme